MLLPVEDGRPTIPSAIFFDFDADLPRFGRRALAEYIAGTDGRLMRALKSILGSQLIEESVRIKKRVLPFIDVLGLFIAELKRRGEADLGAELDHVVVGRPVHFVDDHASPTPGRSSSSKAPCGPRGFGISNSSSNRSPRALDYERQINGEELGLVIDLGGGTSDFSIVRVSPERSRATDRQGDILATAGVHIGGTDFDRLLSMARVMPELGYQSETLDGKRLLPAGPYYDLASWHRINRLYTAKALAELRSTRREARHPERVAKLISIVAHREGHRLASSAETAKIALTEAETATLSFSGEEVTLAVPVTRAHLAKALAHSLDRIAETIAATLAAAGLEAAQIETLILTGGSTQIPAIMARLRQLFPDARFVETDAFGSVGLGLALDAARKFG